MIDELHSMGIKVMVSVWPSVDKKSENFGPMMDSWAVDPDGTRRGSDL